MERRRNVNEGNEESELSSLLVTICNQLMNKNLFKRQLGQFTVLFSLYSPFSLSVKFQTI